MKRFSSEELRELLKKASEYVRNRAYETGTDMYYLDKRSGLRIRENPRLETRHFWDEEKQEYVLFVEDESERECNGRKFEKKADRTC